VDRPAADLVAAMMAAYPPGHPDHEPGDDDRTFVRARLERMISGVEIGPLLGCSRLAVAADGTVAGAALVCDMPGADAPFGGPWIGELFRDPDHPGAGRALLDRAIRQAAIDGLDALGLVVTEGNPARALYGRTGFRLVRTFLNVDVPAGTAAVGA
jgi:GNAT superfamily N-acetyltransferase